MHKRQYPVSHLLRNAGLPEAPISLHATAQDFMVYATPGCGCCRNWVGHLQKNWFESSICVMSDVSPVKDQHRISVTVTIGGYVVEGHVPADSIKRLLRNPRVPQVWWFRECRKAHPVWMFDPIPTT